MDGDPTIGSGASHMDPSSLTTAQLLREIGSLKELVMGEIEGIKTSIAVAHEDLVRVPTETQKQVGNLKELIEIKLTTAAHESSLVRDVLETRLDGMDLAIELLQSTADKFPARMDEKIAALQGVHDERFASIDKQFEERDVRTEQSAQSTKTAVDAALAAQEKSFGKQGETFSASTAKTEESFTKQIDQLGELFRTAVAGLEDKISDLKDRFNRGEGRSEGADKTVITRQTSNSLTATVVAAIIAAVGIATGIVIAVVK